jgi:carboxymethylenebutenolidase
LRGTFALDTGRRKDGYCFSMRRPTPIVVALLSVACAGAQTPLSLADRITAHPRRPALAPGQAMGELVSFPSGEFTLKGYLYKPQGSGPFPAMIWNHGSEKEPGFQPELAAFYSSKGFVFFLPHRHGHGLSPGEYIVDINDRLTTGVKNEETVWPEMVKMHDVYNLDVAAAVAWLKSQPFVDKSRVVMSGVSYGGIQTLVSAERIAGVRGFISFAPAAMSWRMVPLRERLLTAIAKGKAPIFLIQASNDYSTGPSEVLGPVIRRKGPPNNAKLYPDFGAPDEHQKGHGAFSTWNIGIDIWSPEVLAFIDAVMPGR